MVQQDPHGTDDSPHTYECVDCGERVESENHPVECTECGGEMQNISKPRE